MIKLHSLQNRAVRIIFGPTCRLSTDQMYKQVNILKLDQICTFQTSEFMFKNQCNLLPNTLSVYFTTVSSINPYFLHNPNNYRPVACCTNIHKFSIKYAGPSVWNSLPPHLTQTTSILLFKITLSNTCLRTLWWYEDFSTHTNGLLLHLILVCLVLSSSVIVASLCGLKYSLLLNYLL